MTNTNPGSDIPNRGIPKVCILGIGQMGLVCAGALANPDPRGVGKNERAHVIMWGTMTMRMGCLLKHAKPIDCLALNFRDVFGSRCLMRKHSQM